MLLVILVLVIPIITVINPLFKEGNYILGILSFVTYLILCSIINNSAPNLVIVASEVLGLFIYGIGLLYQVKRIDKNEESSL